MTMTLFTILQCALVFCAYGFMTILLPAFVFRGKFVKHRISGRILFYFLAGNFYMINLVFLTEIFHIANRGTLSVITIFCVLGIELSFRRVGFSAGLNDFITALSRLSKRQMGVKTAIRHFLLWMGRKISHAAHKLAAVFLKYGLEWALTMVLTGVLLWLYGVQITSHFGYASQETMSDLYRVNCLEEQKLFVQGIYPVGFHALLYFLHKVFGFDNYILFQVFGLVLTLWVHIVLLLFLKLCCKSKFMPYAGVLVFALGNFWASGITASFCSALPEVYGMAFILPGAYFAMQFFAERKAEILESEHYAKTDRRYSILCLCGFSMALSLVLTVDSAGSVVFLLFFIGIILGFLLAVFRRKNIFSLLLAVLLGFLTAFLPAGTAYVTGTAVSLDEALEADLGEMSGRELSVKNQEEKDNNVKEDEIDIDTYILTENSEQPPMPETTSVQEIVKDFFGNIGRNLNHLFRSMENGMETWVFGERYFWYSQLVMAGMVFLLCMAVLFFIWKERWYGSMFLSVIIFTFLLLMVQTFEKIHLPIYLDGKENALLTLYCLVPIFTVCADAAIYAVGKLLRLKSAMSVLSLAATVGIIIFLYETGSIRGQEKLETAPSDDTFICLTNIIRDEEDFSWTLCSFADEAEMVKNHGWHLENLIFLRNIEQYGENIEATLSSETVYFFIEKSFDDEKEKLGRTISKKDAMHPLPAEGEDIHTQEQRVLIMSRIYFWAQEYEQQYPQEMTIYMENDDFVCYRLEQNLDRLQNLAIDYGYNGRDWDVDTEETMEKGTLEE